MYKRILITGGNGLVGQKLTAIFAGDRSFDLLVTGRQLHAYQTTSSFGYMSLDLLDRGAVKELVWNYGPDVIINAAAFTDVDGAERDKEGSWKANVTAVEHLISAARLVGSKIVHISTDYVFDGKNGPYDEHSIPNPLSYYGKGKLASENAVRAANENWLLIRTMVVFGVAHQVKKNFAVWLVEKLSKGERVTIVDDQIGNVTLADDLASGIYDLVSLNKRGLYHVAGHDMLSRYDFAKKLAVIFGYNPDLISPIKTADLNQLAPRPLRSGLITLKTESEIGRRMNTSEESLRLFKTQLLGQVPS